MEYTKQTWTAPTGTGLSRYAKSGETETHVELALDPVNLTNTPTPFTMARMAHMEDGIAKAYDTAPPTPWAQYSGKDIPQLPDNLAGTTYKRDNDWTTTDGWTTASGGVVSVDNNSIINTVSTALGYLTRGSTYGTGRLIILSYVAPKSGNVSLLGTLNGVPDTLIKTTPVVKGKEKLIVAYAPETLTSIYIFQSSLVSGDIMRITKCYIGSGAYDRLVFDNSYHYRHILNNAVIPTPQGLYFNGATSYLRSKEKITLPDVFTFSATVNCAKTATTYQRIFEVYNSPTSKLLIYINQNTNTLVVEYYNTATSSSEVVGINNFFVDNTDIDTKIEIDFINKTIKFYKNNTLFYNTAVTGIQKPTEGYLYIGSDRVAANVLLGYMRNICLFDTALTDTQRNWLSQGNTPPILYDVTNYKLGNASKANVRVSLRHGNTWFDKTFAGLTGFGGQDVWTDGDNIYLSYETSQFMLNKTTYTWEVKTWTGLTNFDGRNIWADGENIYYSAGTTQYALNKSTSTWTVKPWLDPYGSILITLIGSNIWTDGDNIYYSSGATQYVLNKSIAIWVAKTWFNLTAFNGDNVWTDGENIYYSDGTTQYALNKSTSTWGAKVWAGLPSFFGQHIWADGENIYYSAGTQQFILNKTTYTWVVKTWAGLPNFYYYSLWTDGDNIYSSDGTTQLVLPATGHNYVDDNKYTSLFGTVTKCGCSTLSDKFVFRNE